MAAVHFSRYDSFKRININIFKVYDMMSFFVNLYRFCKSECTDFFKTGIYSLLMYVFFVIISVTLFSTSSQAQVFDFELSPDQLTYTSPENGSAIYVNYNFTNTSPIPLYIFGPPIIPTINAVSGDETDQAVYLGELPPIPYFFDPLMVNPGQTIADIEQFVYQAPNEKDGNDSGTTYYAVDSPFYVTKEDNFFGELANGQQIGFSIQIADVPEPSSWTIMLLGMSAIGVVMRRRMIIGRYSF